MTQSQRSIADAFDAQAARRGGEPAVWQSDLEWSYAEARAASEGVSRCLTRLGLQPGHRVALMLPNSAAYVAGFYGIARPGGVVAPFNVRYRDQELVYYLKDTAAVALLLTPELLEVAEPALEAMGPPGPPALVVVERDGACRVARKGADPAASGEAGGAGDEAALLHQYTSGSTGAPKRIVRTHRQLTEELGRLAGAFDLGANDRFLGAAPFTHVNGLVRTMMTSMFVGGLLHPVADFRRREVLRLVTERRITYFGAVPYMFAILAETPLRGEVDFSSVRVGFSSSAPLRPEDNRRFAEKYGLFLRQLYGSTETGTISVNLDPRPESALESVGAPLDGVRIRILDDEGGVLGPGVEGEVAIESSHAITAYDGNPEANAASFRGGFYLSGDLGHVDERGYLTLTGRKKFLINRGGYKVNPLEVEQAIQSHPKVREVVVAGAPSRYGDEIVRCVVVSSEPCDEAEILEHCRSRIADFKIPSRVEFRDELPKSQTGKVLRQEL